MNNYIRVLIYSKFSPSCKIILDILDQNISLKKSIVFVCIDNAEIRQQIKTDPNLKISIVPCFLHIYDENGYVEMFEGEEAFKMLESSSVELTQILPSSLGSTQILPSSLGSTQIQPPSIQPLLENRDVTFLSSVIDKPEERPRGPLNLTQMASKMQKERESSDIQPQFGPRKN